MKKHKKIAYPQIRYHISYDENLKMKDLEDILHLLRIANNNALYEIGISRSKSNDLQRIDQIEPGSINLTTILTEILSTTISALTKKIIEKIEEKIETTKSSCNTHPKLDKPIYCKYRVDITVGEQIILVESDSPIINIEIKVHNAYNINRSTKQ